MFLLRTTLGLEGQPTSHPRCYLPRGQCQHEACENAQMPNALTITFLGDDAGEVTGSGIERVQGAIKVRLIELMLSKQVWKSAKDSHPWKYQV